MIDRIIGDGRCAIESCEEPAGMNQLMCRKHWSSVPWKLRADVQLAWSRYRMNVITLGELRAVQAEAIKAAK